MRRVVRYVPIIIMLMSALHTQFGGVESSINARANLAVGFQLYDISWLYAFTNISLGNTTIPEGATALSISIRYIGSKPAYGLYINFSSLRLVGDINDTDRYYNDTIPANYSLVFVFVFEEVYRNISLSEYDLPMSITFWVDGEFYRQTLIVPVSVSGVPEIIIYADPLIIRGEGTYEYNVRVKNVGTATAKWVHVVTIGYPPYITIDSPDVYKIGFLSPMEEKEATFRVRVIDTPISTMAFVVNVTYMDERTNDLYWIAETVPVVFNETPEIIVAFSYTLPIHALPGDKYVQLFMTVGNPTRKLIKDVSARLLLPEYIYPSFPGSDSVDIGALPPGYYVNLTFLINIEDNAPTGFYSIPLLFTYEGGQCMEYISLVVKEKVRFEILNVDPDTLEIGATDINFHLKLRNIASVEAKDVYIELQAGGNLKGELAAYIGNVYPSETVDITFYVDVSPDVPEKQAPLDILMVWIQEDRVLSEIYRIMISYVKKGIPIASLEFGLIAVLIIASIYLLYRTVRKIKLYRVGLA